MPTIFRDSGLSFVIYVDDHPPPHVHVRGRGCIAKVAFDGPALVWNRGFARSELKRALNAVELRQNELIRAWIAIHG